MVLAVVAHLIMEMVALEQLIKVGLAVQLFTIAQVAAAAQTMLVLMLLAILLVVLVEMVLRQALLVLP